MDSIDDLDAYYEANCSDSIHELLLSQSFDRFDDKLCETILSYLTFNQKVLFESVSKRWQQLIYNKQKELYLKDRREQEDRHSLNRILIPLEVIDFTTGFAKEMNFKSVNKLCLKSVLQKCKSIESVILDCFVDLEVLDIIGRLCPKLRAMELNTTGLSSNDLDQFGQRYGHLLTKFSFDYENDSYSVWSLSLHYYSKKFLNHCKHLKQLTSPQIIELFSLDDNYLPELQSIKYLKVTEDDIYEYFDDDQDQFISQFDSLCNKYREKMKTFSIKLTIELNKDQFLSVLSSLCKFKKLIDLELYLEVPKGLTYSLNDYLIVISRNNPNLKRFKLNLDSSLNPWENHLSLRLLYAFQGFQNLIELNVKFTYFSRGIPFDANFECFKTLNKLKTLKISILMDFNESFFEDIDKHLPNLSTLEIQCKCDLTDKTISRLSHLKKLKTFRLKKLFLRISDESICGLITSCPSLKLLSFYLWPSITPKTIKTFTDILRDNPNCYLSLHCKAFPIDHQNQFPIDLDNYENILPKNLKIIMESNV